MLVPSTIQKAAVKCMIDMAKDLDWLENKAIEKKLEIRNSNVDQIRSFILGTLTFRLKYVALGAEKGGIIRWPSMSRIFTGTCGMGR